jgi:tetratricopeptide (TPR) repeat protein
LFAGVLLVAVLQAQSPTTVFERGRTAFDRGEYARAIETLRPLLYPEIRLDSEGQVAQAHRMLGVAHLFEKQNDLAAQEFRKLLQLRPEYRFDALLDPPQVVDFFNGVLHDYEGELAKIDAKRKQAEVEERRQREAYERAKNGPLVVEKRYARNSFTINFIPFGAGQFQNGQRGKGWMFLISESALAAVSVGALTTNFAIYGFRPHRSCLPRTTVEASVPCQPDHTDEDRSRLLTRIQLVSGGLFFAVAAWGIADAILHYKPEVPLPPEKPARASTAMKVQLAPVALDGGWGAGLAFRF